MKAILEDTYSIQRVHHMHENTHTNKRSRVIKSLWCTTRIFMTTKNLGTNIYESTKHTVTSTDWYLLSSAKSWKILQKVLLVINWSTHVTWRWWWRESKRSFFLVERIIFPEELVLLIWTSQIPFLLLWCFMCFSGGRRWWSGSAKEREAGSQQEEGERERENPVMKELLEINFSCFPFASL